LIEGGPGQGKSLYLKHICLTEANKGQLNSSRFKADVSTSLQYEGIKRKIEDVIDDVTLITGLVVRDGYDFYSYVHKNIQEYFATAFLTRIPDAAKSEFFAAVATRYSEYRKWQNVLGFLRDIDEYEYHRLFLLPLKRNAIGTDETHNIKLHLRDSHAALVRPQHRRRQVRRVLAEESGEGLLEVAGRNATQVTRSEAEHRGSSSAAPISAGSTT
jgi:hypothetical protein